MSDERPDEASAALALAERAIAGDELADKTLTFEAANGSLEAKRALLGVMLGLSDESYDAMLRVELLARMTALQGDASDSRRFAGILWKLSIEGRKLGLDPAADAAAGEALRVLANLADLGDGQAVEALAKLGSEHPKLLEAAERQLAGAVKA